MEPGVVPSCVAALLGFEPLVRSPVAKVTEPPCRARRWGVASRNGLGAVRLSWMMPNRGGMR